MAFHLIDAYSAVLPKAIADDRFALLRHDPFCQMIPREPRGITLINSAFDETRFSFLEGGGTLGDASGQMYAQRYFTPEMKRCRGWTLQLRRKL